MEYSSGLIEIAQPSHAIKLLAIAAERNEKTSGISNDAEKSIMNKGIILALTGASYRIFNFFSNYILYYILYFTSYHKKYYIAESPRDKVNFCANKLYISANKFPKHFPQATRTALWETTLRLRDTTQRP